MAMGQSAYQAQRKKLMRRRPTKASVLRTGRRPTLFRGQYYQLVVNSQFLGPALSAQVVGTAIHDANLVFVKSPKGTGKTQWLRQYVESLPAEMSIVQIGHRRSLARALAIELGLTCYLDSSQPDWRYALSIDSLAISNQADMGYHVVIIDEVEQVLRQLTSETTKDNRGEIFNALIRLINKAKQIVLLDADLSGELTVHLIEKLRRSFQQDRIISIVNEWKTDRSIEVYESKRHLLTELVCAISEGKRVYVPVGELGLAKAIKSIAETFINANGDPTKVLLLTGPTSDEESSQAFFNDPNGEAVKYQVIVATSTLSTGVSIDVDHFDAIFGLFDSSVYTYHDCDQAISRVRKCDVVKVWVHRGVKATYQSEGEIRSGPVKKELLTRSYALHDSNGRLSEGDELYMDVESRIRWCEQKWKDNRTEQFIDLKKDEGWTVNLIPVDVTYDKAGEEILKFGKDPDSDKYTKQVLAADNLSAEKFHEYASGSNLRGAKARAVKKYWIAKFYELSSPAEVTLKQIMAYENKGVRGIVDHAKLLKASRVDAINADRSERENPNKIKVFTSYEHRSVKREILVGAQNAAGVDYAKVMHKAKLHVDNEIEFSMAKEIYKPNSDGYRKASKKRNAKRKELKWIVTQEQIDNLANYVAVDLDRVNLFCATNFKNPTAAETKTKVFNTLMGELGVELKKKPKSKESDAPEYFIDYNRVAELVATKDLTEFT
jgi:hypothetical protein